MTRQVYALAAVALAAVLPGCGLPCSGRIEVTNNTQVSRVVKLEGHGERSLAASEVYLWEVSWDVMPGDEKRTEFDYFVDGKRCGTYILWDGERSRTLDTYYCANHN